MFDQTSPTEEAARLGATLRARRRALGMTQEELAELARTTQRFVSTLENGKPTVRLDRVIEVADALGLRLAVHDRTASPQTEDV